MTADRGWPEQGAGRGNRVDDESRDNSSFGVTARMAPASVSVLTYAFAEMDKTQRADQS